MLGRCRRLALILGVIVVVSAVGITAVVAAPPDPNATPAPGAQTQTQGTRYGQVFLDKLAGLLGVTTDQLTSGMKQATKDTADEAVKNGDLTQEQADRFKQRVDEASPGACGPGMLGWGRGWDRGVGKAGPKAFAMPRNTILGAVADKLGMSTEALMGELRSGKTLADLATAQGLSEQDLKDAANAAIKTQLDQAVEDGKLTQEQADRLYQAWQKAPLGLGFGRMEQRGPRTGPWLAPRFNT